MPTPQTVTETLKHVFISKYGLVKCGIHSYENGIGIVVINLLGNDVDSTCTGHAGLRWMSHTNAGSTQITKFD